MSAPPHSPLPWVLHYDGRENRDWALIHSRSPAGRPRLFGSIESAAVQCDRLNAGKI